MSACYESRHVSRPMRRALEEYRGADADGDEQGDDAGDMAEVVASREQRVAALEIENRALRETVEAQSEQSRLVLHWRTSRLQLLTLSRQRCSLLRTTEVIRGGLANSWESVT